MDTLKARTIKFYLIKSFQLVVITIGLGLLLFVEGLFFGIGEADQMIESINLGSTGLLIGIMLMPAMYAIYGPNLYDSLVLSMGARRIDIFWGNILKEVTFSVCSAIIICIFGAVIDLPNFTTLSLIVPSFGLIMSALCRLVAIKFKNVGKLAIVVVALISGFVGATVGYTFEQNTLVDVFSNMNVGLFVVLGIIGVVAYAIVERLIFGSIMKLSVN
ncbi:MAG: hypothetical protein K6E79_06700 [Pseudobutyrivibrio sp.]|nr:hypothetical protein [Pseudobutyrivibrio sp.]